MMKNDDIAENVLQCGKEGVRQNMAEALNEFCEEYADEMWKAVEEIIKLRAENAALRNEADENAALSIENKMRADRLEKDNAALRERLSRAVELPRVECIKTWEWLNRERFGDIVLEWCVLYKKDGYLMVEPCLSKEAAEARLKELQGGEE